MSASGERGIVERLRYVRRMAGYQILDDAADVLEAQATEIERLTWELEEARLYARSRNEQLETKRAQLAHDRLKIQGLAKDLEEARATLRAFQPPIINNAEIGR